MKRPSLLRDLRVDDNDQAVAATATPWKVGDTQLRPIPPFYPPMNPRCTAMVVDAPASVVAARIAACLTSRSVSVEYDDEAVSRNVNVNTNVWL